MKINYPNGLVKGDKVAVTALSSGVEQSMHILLEKAKRNLITLGYEVVLGNTVWKEEKARSAAKEIRAEEFMEFYTDPLIKAIIPPWGGQFAIEILPLIDWENLKKLPPKWILGYSDISTFNFVYTTTTGNASAHGINFNEMSAPQLDETSSRWHDVLTANKGDFIKQNSSKKFQSSWEKVFQNPATGFYLDTKTEWKSTVKRVSFSGRLIGGILNTLQLLHGTPFDNVESYIENCTIDVGTVWYFESVDMSAAEIYRALWQMKINGWFKNTNGILIGRLSGYTASKDYELLDVLEDIFSEANIPFVYDVDISHLPPQITLVNGAIANIRYQKGVGEIELNLN
ncbi:microcin immunity protein [Fictibacillus phosphorivorans]|uniref:Microcin immunity protein n=1 Tax=Fictibacillus phosphorivorans TaxID=1221500 RepID=A0A161IH25_9BACL|nr:S66 peptidase family protein [Fictibacillus phosphorivorans]ANC77429.1 microcin immunity protein [Fictibacillus phosphorivorans]